MVQKLDIVGDKTLQFFNHKYLKKNLLKLTELNWMPFRSTIVDTLKAPQT